MSKIHKPILGLLFESNAKYPNLVYLYGDVMKLDELSRSRKLARMDHLIVIHGSRAFFFLVRESAFKYEHWSGLD